MYSLLKQDIHLILPNVKAYQNSPSDKFGCFLQPFQEVSEVSVISS